MAARRYSQQPPGAAPIDRSNRFGRALAFLSYGGQVIDVISKAEPVALSAVNGLGPKGRGFLCNGSGKQVEYNLAPLVTSNGAGTGDFTIFFYGDPISEATNRALYTQKNDGLGAPFTQVGLYANTSDFNSAVAGQLSLSGYSGSSWGGEAPSVIDGLYHLYIATVIAGVVNFYIDGVLATTINRRNSQLTVFAAGQLTSLGADAGTGNNPYNRLIPFVGSMNIGMSAADVKDFTANPFQVIAAPPRKLPGLPGAAHATLVGLNATGPATSTSGALTQHHEAAGAAASSKATSQAGQLVQHHHLGGAPAASTAASTRAAITQHHEITGAASSSKATAGVGAIVQHHELGGANARQPNTCTTGALGQARNTLAGLNATSTATSTRAPVAQHHKLGGAAATQPNTCSTGAIGAVRATLAGAPATSTATSTAGALVQHHRPVGSPASQNATATRSPVVQHHHLGGQGATQANSCTTGAIGTHRAVLAGAPCSGAATSARGVLVQHHRIVGAACAQYGRSPGAALPIVNYVAPIDRMWRAPATARYWADPGQERFWRAP